MYVLGAVFVAVSFACLGAPSLMVLLPPPVLALFLWRRAVARRGRDASCEVVGTPVALDGFYARELAFRFDSRRAAAAFAQAYESAGNNVLGVDLGGSPAVTVGATPIARILGPPIALLVAGWLAGVALQRLAYDLPTPSRGPTAVVPAPAGPAPVAAPPAPGPAEHQPARHHRHHHRTAPAR